MKSIFVKATLVAAMSLMSYSAAAGEAVEKPVQHLQLKEVASLTEAKNVFNETTAEMQAFQELDANALHQIHLITYRLEKSVAFFVANSDGADKAFAQEVADQVEVIHLASENNRADEAKSALSAYFAMAEKLASTF